MWGSAKFTTFDFKLNIAGKAANLTSMCVVGCSYSYSFNAYFYVAFNLALILTSKERKNCTVGNKWIHSNKENV